VFFHLAWDFLVVPIKTGAEFARFSVTMGNAESLIGGPFCGDHGPSEAIHLMTADGPRLSSFGAWVGVKVI
jgi:hypothetical protein